MKPKRDKTKAELEKAAVQQLLVAAREYADRAYEVHAGCVGWESNLDVLLGALKRLGAKAVAYDSARYEARFYVED